MQILNRYTNEVIIESLEVKTIKELVELAVKEDANLRDANLRDADLRDADLRGANLRGANLVRANLVRANLVRANLEDANLVRANLEDANLPNFLITPETGSFQAYKKLRHNIIVKILIPDDAKRTNSLIGRKCRTNEFTITEVMQNPANISFSEHKPLQSTHYASEGYYLGGTFKEPAYDDDIRLECTKGLHFFMTLKEAQDW